MSSTEEHTQDTGSFIKTPRQLIVTVILAFAVPITLIFMLTHMVAVSSDAGTGSTADTPQAIEARIKPIATLKLAEANTPAAAQTAAATPAPAAAPAPKPAEVAKAAPAPKAAPAAPAKPEASAAGGTKVASIPGLPAGAATNPVGEHLYKTVCFACHAAGVMGAPTFGSMEKWAPFIKTGIDTMVKNAIHGVGNMPPRGGSQATDAQMRAGVEYMVSHAK